MALRCEVCEHAYLWGDEMKCSKYYDIKPPDIECEDYSLDAYFNQEEQPQK